jgi:hypothetical protein
MSLKSEDGFSMQRAVVHLGESLDGISQREAFYDGDRFKCARFEARRELFEDSRAGHGVIGARVHAEERFVRTPRARPATPHKRRHE